MNKKLTINNRAYLQEAFKKLKEFQEKETVRIEYIDGSWSVKDEGGNETYYFADSYDDAVNWCESKPWIEDWYENDINESLTESNDKEVEIDTCAIRLDTRNISYKAVLSDINERIRDNELSIIKEKNHPPFVEYIIQGNKDSIYSFLHTNRRRIKDYRYLPQNESYREDLTEASHPYKGFTVKDEDSHYVIRDFNGTVQSRADTPEEAHQIIDSELGTKRLIVDVNKFSNLDSYCKKFNLSIVNQERAPYMEFTLQGDLNNINALIDYIDQYKALVK